MLEFKTELCRDHTFVDDLRGCQCPCDAWTGGRACYRASLAAAAAAAVSRPQATIPPRRRKRLRCLQPLPQCSLGQPLLGDAASICWAHVATRLSWSYSTYRFLVSPHVLAALACGFCAMKLSTLLGSNCSATSDQHRCWNAASATCSWVKLCRVATPKAHVGEAMRAQRAPPAPLTVEQKEAARLQSLQDATRAKSQPPIIGDEATLHGGA